MKYLSNWVCWNLFSTQQRQSVEEQDWKRPRKDDKSLSFMPTSDWQLPDNHLMTSWWLMTSAWQLLTARAKSCSTIINCSSKIKRTKTSCNNYRLRRLLIAGNCEWHYCGFLLWSLEILRKFVTRKPIHKYAFCRLWSYL